MLVSPVLTMMSSDLRRAPADELGPLMSMLDMGLPTLVLSECVFPYISPDATSAVLRWFSEKFTQIATISYDMFGLDDSFGRVMADNLKVMSMDTRRRDRSFEQSSNR